MARRATEPSPGEGAGGRVERRPWIGRQDWLFAVALASLVGVGVWFGRSIQDFLTPPSATFAAPALVGEALGDAYGTAARAKLRIGVAARIASDQYPKGTVMRQDPSSGTQVRQGRQLSVVVSTGVPILPMPDLRYQSRREVGLELSRYKLALGKVRTVSSEDVPADAVVAQRPSPLTPIREGTVVDIDLARGGPQSVTLPDFVSGNVGEARERAAAARIAFGQIVWTPFGRDGPPRGIVVRQKPGPGAQLSPGESVSLQISAGPREAGYLVREVHAAVTVPQLDAGSATPSTASRTIRVQVRDETGTWNAYNAYAQPKQRLDFNLTVIGTSELDVFVDGELADSTKLGIEPPLQERQILPPRAVVPAPVGRAAGRSPHTPKGTTR